MLKTVELVTKDLGFFEEDYKYASIDFLWYRIDTKRMLLYSLIQMWPQEFPKPEETQEESFKISKDREYIYHKSITISSKDAIQWYKNALEGNSIELIGQTGIFFETENYQQYIKWPHTIVSRKLPFGIKYEKVRYHGLLGAYGKEIFKQIFTNTKCGEWINSKLMFDISKYGEYAGSINIIAYNPLYRELHQRIILKGEQKGNVICEVEPRAGKDLSHLKIITANKSELGHFFFREISLSENNFIIQYPEFVGAVGYAVVCPERGLLDYQKFLPFVQEISINMGLVSGIHKVSIHDKKTNTKDTYATQKITYENTSVGSKDNTSDELVRQTFRENELIRNRLKKEESRGSKVLYNDDKEAISYIRNIISKAIRRAVLIDPYITTQEIYRFATALESTNAEIIVVTSAKESLNKKVHSKGKNTIKEKDILKKKLSSINKLLPKLQIYVMSGTSSRFHDRFIIIDDDLWIVGTSLKMVGKSKISLITKIEQSYELINIFTTEYKKMQTFKQWYKNG